MSISVAENINSFNVSNVSNVSIHNTVADDQSEILKWLSPLEPRIRHQDVQTRRAGDVGEWLLQTGEFERWCDGAQHEGSGHQILFCCGGPGVGETYLSSLVVDKLCDMAGARNVSVSCFYVDFAAREEQSPTNILGSLLKQIVGGLERIPDEISRMFQDHKKVIGGRGLRVAEIVKMLQTVASLKPTFICVDALDECVERHRPEILDSLRRVLEESPNTQIFLTGRRHIRGEVGKCFCEKMIVLSIKPNQDDIVGYVQMRLSKDTSQDRIDGGLEGEIIKSITENIPESFLLISLTMDAILGQTTAYGRRQKLKAITEGLDLKDVYGATLERIKEQGGERARLGMATLMWISHSERLLQLDELLHALAVEIGSTDLDAENIPSVETLLSCCLGLVVVDRDALTIRLIHFTLQEYLYTCPDIFGSTHSIMAETCLTYLNFRAIKEILSLPFNLPQSAPFLNYSSLYWGVHAGKQASQGVVSLVLQLFSQIETHISTKLLLKDLQRRTDHYFHHIPTDDPVIGFTGLHCASVFGLAEIVTTLMNQPNCSLDERDLLGITPLIWAAICGQEEVLKLLLEQQTVHPDKPDTYPGRTALSWAAVMGHEEIVRLLLERASAKPDGTDGWWGKTPRVVNMVRGRRYVNPDWPDKYGQTPALLAAKQGHERVVKLLFGRKDVKFQLADHDGRTPLSWAAKNGHDGIVRLLFGREDTNPDSRDNDGRTPLALAAWRGRDGAVKLLLAREGVNPDIPDNHGRTALFLAAGRGHDGVVKLLLGLEEVNPDMPDDRGLTPLSAAAWNGRDGVMKLLLEREEVNPDMPDNRGLTPLSQAALYGRDGAVRLLLGREGVNPDMPDNYGLTPLSRAAWCGHDGAVKLLLGREEVNPDTPDIEGRTPLSRAAWDGCDGVVKLLLGKEGVNPDMRDNNGRTPLSWAAAWGRDGVVKLLLGREDVNPNRADNGGRTPLLWAAENGHDGVVELLLRQDDVNPNTPDNRGQTPLSLAAINGHRGVVELLIAGEGINPDMSNRGGLTPLSLAFKKGHDKVVKLLQARIFPRSHSS